ncbi:hypothetical protein [Mycobacterium sp. Lab-001]|uniref:hypothetical protein n=1 Tax=Mycobacterium sp. Lab-001 TaxID=3410136 RepID=UPI003D16BA5D
MTACRQRGTDLFGEAHFSRPGIKSPTREQIFCFGADGLRRRHDYTVDILSGSPGLNYATGYREVSGIMIPTIRRVYAWRGDYECIPDPLLVAIDMGDIVTR